MRDRRPLLLPAIVALLAAPGAARAQIGAAHQGRWVVLAAGSPQSADTIFVGARRETVLLTICLDETATGPAWVGVRLNGSLVAGGILKGHPAFRTCTTFTLVVAAGGAVDVSSSPVSPAPPGSLFGNEARGSYVISVAPR